MEKFPIKDEEILESLEEKHKKWLMEARVMLEGIGFGTLTIGASYYILKNLGVEIPFYILAGTNTPAIGNYMSKRWKELNEK